MNLNDFPGCDPLTPWNPVGNSHAVDELVVQHGQALPLFIVHLKPFPEDNKPREIVVECQNSTSVLEVESAKVDSVEYLLAALQHHFKTADSLHVEYFDQVRHEYLPLVDVNVLNQGDLTHHKLRVQVSFLFIFLLFLLLHIM